MTEARKRAATLAAEIETAVGKLPEGTWTSIWSGWRSESAGAFSVGIRIHKLSNGTIVDFEIAGRTKHARKYRITRCQMEIDFRPIPRDDGSHHAFINAAVPFVPKARTVDLGI